MSAITGAIARITSLALLAVAITCPAARASSSCSSAVLACWFRFQGGDTDFPAVTFDTTIVNTDGDTTRIRFDRAQASLNLNAVGRVWAGERVTERFDVTGVPTGTPIRATVLLNLQGVVHDNCGGGGCGAPSPRPTPAPPFPPAAPTRLPA